MADEELALARKYVGVDEDDNAIPGVVVVAPDRSIVFRRVGESPDDRISTEELLAVVDGVSERYRVATSSTTVELSGGFAPRQRRMLRVATHAGARRGLGDDSGVGLSLDLDVTALFPLHRYLAVGGLVRGATGASTRLDFDAAVRLRYPLAGAAGELYLQLPFGVSRDPTAEGDEDSGFGANVGGQLGVQFALFPSLAVSLEAATTYHRVPVARSELRFALGIGFGLLF